MSDLEMCKVLTARWVRLLSELADTAKALGEQRGKLTAEQLGELHAWIAEALGQPATPASDATDRLGRLGSR